MKPLPLIPPGNWPGGAPQARHRRCDRAHRCSRRRIQL